MMYNRPRLRSLLVCMHGLCKRFVPDVPSKTTISSLATISRGTDTVNYICMWSSPYGRRLGRHSSRGDETRRETFDQWRLTATAPAIICSRARTFIWHGEGRNKLENHNKLYCAEMRELFLERGANIA